MESDRVSHYRLIEHIGSGGMGEVWLAEDTRLKRNVALKFLPHYASQEATEKARFQQEAQAAARLNHPNIAQVYEIGEEDGRLYIVMEYVAGGSLSDRLAKAKGRPLPIEDVLNWIRQTAEGLAEAHKQGIVHRDIKPDNLMLTASGQVKITDFGLAKIETATRLTASGATLGTINYMSPEQVVGKEIDHRSDLFSLGATFYELFTGHRLFEGVDANATYFAILNEDMDPLNRYRRTFPEGLEEIVRKLIEKDPSYRYQSALEVSTDLRRITVTTEIKTSFARPTKTIRERLREFSVESWITLGLIVAIIIVMALPQVALYRRVVQDVMFSDLGPPFDELMIDEEKVIKRLERRKQTGDANAYVASVLIDPYRDNAEEDLDRALQIKKTDASLYALSAQLRYNLRYTASDSIAELHALEAVRLDPDNGAYSFLAFLGAIGREDYSEADELLSISIESPRFELGWTDHYGAVYWSLEALNLLHPTWPERHLEVEFPRGLFTYSRGPIATYLGGNWPYRAWRIRFLKSLRDLDPAAEGPAPEEIGIRGAGLEAVGYRLMADETATSAQVWTGRLLAELGIWAQLQTGGDDDAYRGHLQSRHETISRMYDSITESAQNREEVRDRIAKVGAYTLGVCFYLCFMLIWTLFAKFLSKRIARITPDHSESSWKTLGIALYPALIYVVGICFSLLLIIESWGLGIAGLLGTIILFLVLLPFLGTKNKIAGTILRHVVVVLSGLLIVWLGAPLFRATLFFWSGEWTIVFVLMFAVVLSFVVFWFRNRETIGERLTWLLSKIALISAVLILIMVLSLASQSVGLAPELYEVMRNPSPSLIITPGRAY